MGLLSTIGAASGRAFGFTRSAIAQAVDAYFNLTTLLLPGDGTNGAQNNTFLDSSSNNFTITRNGNTTQGSFSPFSQTGWGVNFNRGYLSSTLTGQAAGTGSFTYELFFWVNIKDAAISNVAALFNTRGSGTGADGFDCQITTAGAVQIGTSGSTLFTSANSLVADNTWYHLAIVRNGTTNCTVYLNGSSIGTYTASTNYSSTNLYLGVFGGLNDWFKGYVSNFRYTRDAVYTAGFTVPTSPLTPITNTQFLTAQSNRYLDTSANAFAITPVVANGGTSVQAFSPFLPTAAYSAATVGGSGYFDGTGDYLSNSSLSPSWSPGSSDFCIEGWGYWTSFNFGSYGAPIISFVAASGQLMIRANKTSASTTSANYYSTSNGVFIPSAGFSSGVSGGTLHLNTWNHIALTRSGSTFRLFVNGELVSTQTDATAYGSAYNNVAIGSDNTPSNGLMAGYIAGVRVVAGNAVYTAAFTPATAPPTAISGTYILTNFTNAGITDATAKNDLETVGNAQISTTQSKWGGGSIYMDGTGDNLVVGPNPLLNFGLSDFTIEFWIYPTTFAGGISPMYSTLNRAKADVLAFDVNTGGSMAMYGTPLGGNVWTLFNANNVGTLTANTWQHVALVRSGSTWSAYLNGVRGAGFPVTNASALASIDGFNIGFNGAGGGYLNGYMDDIRISRYARYSGASFTVPSAPFETR